MRIQRVVLRRLQMEYLFPFATSGWEESGRDFLLVEVSDADGLSGHAEVVCTRDPYYIEETVVTCLHILKDFLVPMVLGQTFTHPSDVLKPFRKVRRHHLAKSGLESALWDLYARRQGQPLARALGGVHGKVPVGISIGIQPTVAKTLAMIEGYLAEGYRRIKLKIKPGWDLELIAAVRRHFGAIPLMADANSAYTLADLERLRALDEFDLMMIEQPLAHDDIIDHATLQQALRTPVCLDESVHSPEDARKALDLGACRIINIKIGRVGGLTNARAVEALCRSRGVPVWCGGMLESGVGRAHNVAIAALPGFTLPGDTAPSRRYWREDIIDPWVEMDRDGCIPVPTGPGMGYAIRWDLVQKFTSSVEEFRA